MKCLIFCLSLTSHLGVFLNLSSFCRNVFTFNWYENARYCTVADIMFSLYNINIRHRNQTDEVFILKDLLLCHVMRIPGLDCLLKMLALISWNEWIQMKDCTNSRRKYFSVNISHGNSPTIFMFKISVTYLKCS